MKIYEIVDLWYDEKKRFVKRSTLSAYHLLLFNHILPELGEREASEITNKVMNEYAISLVDKGLSKKTSLDICIVLKMILSYAMENLGCPYIKFKIVFPSEFEVNTSQIDVYNPDEYRQMVQYAVANLTSKRLGILITLLSGVRIGEICALRWKNVDVENKLIKIRETVQRIYVRDMNKGTYNTEISFDRPKTSGSNRDVPIANEILPLLKALKKITNEEFFVATGCEKWTEPRTYRAYYKIFILQEVKLKRCLKFHGIRHSFASRLIASGADLKTTSRILGHSNVTTTMNLYVHPTMNNKLDAVNKSMKNLFK